MYIFERLYLKYVLQKRKLDRDKKRCQTQTLKTKAKQNMCMWTLFVCNFDKSPFPKASADKIPGISKTQKQIHWNFIWIQTKITWIQKKQKNKSDQIWSNLMIWSDLIRFDFSVFFDIVWFFLNSSEFFLVSQVFFLYVFNSNHFFGFNANWLCWIPVKFWLKNWSNLSCQVVFRIYGT